MRKIIILTLTVAVSLSGLTSCQNNDSSALLNSDNSIDLSPNSAESYIRKGNAKVLLGDDTGAIHDYTKAIELNHKYAEAYYLRGNARSALDENIGRTQDLPSKDFEGSMKALNKDITLDMENDPPPYDSKGLGKFELGDDSGAIRDYTKAIELDPKYAEAYFARGLEKEKLEDNTGALADLNKAVELGYPKALEEIKRIQKF